MKIKLNPKQWLQLGALVVVLSMSPFAFTTEGKVQVQEALCEETGTCCLEENSICVGGHVGFYSTSEPVCP